MAAQPQPQQPKRSYDELRERFKQLCEKSPDEQQELFLKSFIFALGENWKVINVLNKTYKKYVADGGESKPDLNVVQAADFLQKNGVERTAIQRKQEITDIDLDKNDRISFIEYLLLQYKGLVLQEYYKRTGESHKYDLSNNGVGITGVGYQVRQERHLRVPHYLITLHLASHQSSWMSCSPSRADWIPSSREPSKNSPPSKRPENPR